MKTPPPSYSEKNLPFSTLIGSLILCSCQWEHLESLTYHCIQTHSSRKSFKLTFYRIITSIERYINSLQNWFPLCFHIECLQRTDFISALQGGPAASSCAKLSQIPSKPVLFGPTDSFARTFNSLLCSILIIRRWEFQATVATKQNICCCF